MADKITIPKTKKRYRFMQGFLDKVGMMTAIDEVGKKHFIFYLNGEAKKTYRTRKSCNNQIFKLFNQHYENSNI